MNARQRKVVARFGQVLTFLDANTGSVPPASVASQRQQLTTSIAQINGFAQDQVLKGNESVLAQTLSSARVALRDTYVRQLSTIGLLNLTGKHPGDPNVPNAAGIFALPSPRTNAGALSHAAKTMLTAANAYASVFTSRGVDLNAVDGSIKALDAAIAADDSAKRTAKGATQGIKAQVQAGQGAVRMMDVVIRPLLATSKSLLTQWESVKRAAGGASNLVTPVIAATSATPAASSSTTASTPSATATTNPQPTSASAPASTTA